MTTTQAFRIWRDANQRAHAATVAALHQAAVTRQTAKIGMAIALQREAGTLFHAWRKECHEREAEAVQMYLGFSRAAQLMNRYEPRVRIDAF